MVAAEEAEGVAPSAAAVGVEAAAEVVEVVEAESSRSPRPW